MDEEIQSLGTAEEVGHEREYSFMDEEIQSLGTAEEVGHAVVDVEGLLNSMKEKLDSISESPPPFHICRVPATIRKDNHVYYDPKIVSIGPFHRQGTNLLAMEEHKWRYLHNVLDHCTSKPALEECVKELKKIEEKARKCYSGDIDMGFKSDDEFVKMMLLDGSFIVQLLLLRNKNEENDPIFRNIWMLPAIADDMLLLENQLPFCVLECLAECIGRDANALKKEALLFFSKYLPDTLNFKQNAKNGHITSDDTHHLLHLVHRSLKPAPPTPEKPFCAQLLQLVRKILSFVSLWRLANNNHQYELLTEVQPQEAGASSITVQHQEAGASSITVKRVITIPTATELKEAGVVFKRNEGGSLLDVTFKKGEMRLPRLQIAHNTNSLFRNIIAFEQCFPDSVGDFTSYCFFMDSLVNTPRDAQILKQSDIIEHLLGSDEDVAVLFNQLCKGIAYVGKVECKDVKQYAEGKEVRKDVKQYAVGKVVCKAVKQYAKKRRHKWRAKLTHDYFSHPWAVISLIAAVYIIFLTSVQTYYAAF